MELELIYNRWLIQCKN